MRTYMLICALAGLLLKTSGQTVSKSSTTSTETPALRQSSPTETVAVTSATIHSQSSTTKTGAATNATSHSESSTTETGAATSATSHSQSITTKTGAATSATSHSQSSTTKTGAATSATSHSQSSTSEASVPSVTSGTKPSFNETTESTVVSTTPAETNTNATEGGNSSSPTVKPEITKTTTTPPTPVKKDCTATSCGNSFATCIQLYNSYICQCPLRYFFNETDLSCTRGDSFYGNLQLSNESFNPKKDSQEYSNLYNKVLNYFKTCFENETSYSDTIITDISELSPKVQTRSTRQLVSVDVSCYHVFKPQTISEEKVQEAINKYNASNLLGIYYQKNICDGFYCDSKTTNCLLQANSDPICTCQDEFFHTSSSLLTSCRDCDLNCAGEGKQCIWSDFHEKAICSCLPDYYSRDNSCEKCQFGYSGEECTDNFLLILVIVGSIAGAIVIALLGTVIGLSVKSSRRKRDNERIQLITKDNMDSPKTGNLFPKIQAKTDLGYVDSTSSAYDITDAYSRPIPQQDYDDDDSWYEMSGRERRN